jgi:flagellar biosynthesis component FlhA
MQVELLLHRLNENRRLLVFNLLERWPLDTIVRLARQLLRARRSIRNLESLAEAMLNYDHALPAPDELELANLVNAFGDAASAWAI